jgi:hypothetical protein
MPDTSVLIGSVEIAAESITVNGGGAVNIAAGSYYLRHATASISLLDTLAALITSEGVGGVSVNIRQDSRVRITALGAFDITLSARLQRLLGYSVAHDGSAAYAATLISPLLWAPGYLGTPATRLGKLGYKVPHTTDHKSDDGTRVERQYFGEDTWQELSWDFIDAARLMVPDASDDGGTLEGLYEECLKYNRPFQWYDVVSLDGTSSGVIWPAPFGPYQMRRELGRPNWYDRIRKDLDDVGGGVNMDLIAVEELSNA